MKIISVILLFLFCTGVFAQSPQWAIEPPPLSLFESPNYKTWLPDESPSAETAQKLNEMGFDEYQEGRYIRAASMWKASLLMDPKNPWAHYNYAAALAIFAQGFGDFDAPGDDIPDIAWDRWDFFDYREAIILHLKTSVLLRPERAARLVEDPDFDNIRRLESYRNVLMGPNPDAATILEYAPEWYSLQKGAFSPSDLLTFSPDGSVTFVWDTRRFDEFPSVYTEGKRIDESFEGTWHISGDDIVVDTNDGRTLIFRFRNKMDHLGFIRQRILLYGELEYGDYESHYWEGQDA